MIVVRHFIPKQRVVLFNSRVHHQIKGVLHISNSKESSFAYLFPKKQAFSFRKPKSKLRLNILISRRYLQRAVFACLFISILGFATLTTPLLILEISHKIMAYNPKPYMQTAKLSTDESFLLKDDFRIIIPRLGIDSKIIANVDPINEGEYNQKLQEGIAHARGSYLPDGGGPIFLFAHSAGSLLNIAQYNAQFYAVKDLDVGDDIEILYQGKRYIYKVSDKKIIAPQDLDYIRESTNQLFLQTCWPPGTQWQRLVVSAKMTS